jgi:leucine-rich repeat protein SHOC2
MCNGRHPYRIYDIRGEMPNWLSYKGEGCSLSFHIPPVFQGLVLWFDKDSHYYFDTDIIIIIRNKSNGIQLFKDKQIAGRWIRYISRSEMAMEDYCGDDELELYISSVPTGYAGRNGHSFEPVHVKECGVHVIAGKSDSCEESEVKRDAVMPSPLPYHLLPHPHCGSIRASTPEQWSDYLFAKLREHTLSSRLYGKNKYFI